MALWDLRTADVTECCRMGFHRLSLVLYRNGDSRSEECTGSRHYTGYHEKHRRWTCVETFGCSKNPQSTLFYDSAIVPL